MKAKLNSAMISFVFMLLVYAKYILNGTLSANKITKCSLSSINIFLTLKIRVEKMIVSPRENTIIYLGANILLVIILK